MRLSADMWRDWSNSGRYYTADGGGYRVEASASRVGHPAIAGAGGWVHSIRLTRVASRVGA